MKNRFIDFHCHPTLKPYSRSYKDSATIGQNSTNLKAENSIWFRERLSGIKKILNSIFSLTKFTQADFSSAFRGGAQVLMVSIDPMEKELILSKIGNQQLNDGKLIKDLLIGIGRERIDHLFGVTNYFEDLEKTRDFLLSKAGEKVTIAGKEITYKVVSAATEIDFDSENTLYIVVTFEGAHVFRSILASSMTAAVIEDQVLRNIKKVKHPDWGLKPFFVAPVHHFNYGYCGRAESLTTTSLGGWAYDQKLDAKQQIEPLGQKVIDALLSKENGGRILIDVKHMNIRSRRHYYKILSEKYATENIPIIVSHGAITFTHFPNVDTNEINFYYEEIVKIAQSRGIFGIQLDERRLKMGKYGSKDRAGAGEEKPKLVKRAFYVWRQIEAMALEVYSKNTKHSDGLPVDPWGFQVLGSDFDGIVDPLNGFWRHSEMPKLRKYLLKHATFFLTMPEAKVLRNYNDLTADMIINKFMYGNAKKFLETNHK